MTRTATGGGIVFAALLCLFACSKEAPVKDGVATDDGIAAIALPEEQLQFMLGRSVIGSQTGPMALYNLGLDRGCEVFEVAVRAAVERYLTEWKANLVKAYRDTVPADELARAVQASPREAWRLLSSRLPTIGSAMQQASQPLLTQASTEVLAAMSREAAQADPADIDLHQRQQELQRMTAEGKICGFGALQEAA